VTQIVELALERLSTELPKVKSEKPDAANFWRKLNKSLYPTGREPDIDLEAIVAEHRKPHEPLKF
jgi:hypothetical protein